MSAFFAIINHSVEGPFEFNRLVEMNVSGDTVVSSVEEPEKWKLFRDVPGAPIFEEGVVPQQSGKKLLREVRDDLRKSTAYSSLRSILSFFIWADVASAGIFIIIALFNVDRLPVYVPLIFFSFCGMVPLLVASVLIDIADSLLRKVED